MRKMHLKISKALHLQSQVCGRDSRVQLNSKIDHFRNNLWERMSGLLIPYINLLPIEILSKQVSWGLLPDWVPTRCFASEANWPSNKMEDHVGHSPKVQQNRKRSSSRYIAIFHIHFVLLLTRGNLVPRVLSLAPRKNRSCGWPSWVFDLWYHSRKDFSRHLWVLTRVTVPCQDERQSQAIMNRFIPLFSRININKYQTQH